MSIEKARFRQPEEIAYLALLQLPIGGTMRADQAIQSAMASLRDRISYAQQRDAEAVQDEYERLAAGSKTHAIVPREATHEMKEAFAKGVYGHLDVNPFYDEFIDKTWKLMIEAASLSGRQEE